KGTWREFMHSTVNSQDLAAFIPRFAAKLVESPCPYGVGFENWTKLVWLCQTYNEIMENELTDPLTAKDFYASRVKKMYEVLEYSANTCW
ncbi:MAG: hypothetical protein JNL70_25845, partial [Saprospiraceae bacterium]|nr:hypothetical protein [Saprospiraceae bacterium]